ncbi:MAG: hypothetical protein E7812_07810 [Phenylobacterium sp.]|nr:MAG: hypothetical protein E7812_07810 [Phenylobacterium sp.]
MPNSFGETLQALGVPMFSEPDDAPTAASGQDGSADPGPPGPVGSPAASAPSDPCEFTFIGGAGVGGDYLDALKQSFERGGIAHVHVPNHPAAFPWEVAGDAISIPHVNDLSFAKGLVDTPEARAAAQHSLSLGDEQYNLGGYSYGAAAAAANAYAVAQNGGKVDNLVLLGAPINQDLYDAVTHNPRIKNVVNLDLGAYGDPIHAGMTDGEILRAAPKLAGQWASGQGHFRYSGDGPVFDQRRDELTQQLLDRGLR